MILKIFQLTGKDVSESQFFLDPWPIPRIALASYTFRDALERKTHWYHIYIYIYIYIYIVYIYIYIYAIDLIIIR